jgi:hypothetical protein
MIAAVLLVSVCFLMGCTGEAKSISDLLPGNGPKVVGQDIKMGDITEFYFTYSSSTNPPEFQRYHFSVKDGVHRFYHEKREGNHWPLRETDITVSGTKELSQDDWQTFFNYIKDGKVEKRKEHLESGGRGPWLFLYWKGDKGKFQEFAFPSWSAQKSFEDFCIKLKNAQLNRDRSKN